MTIIQLAKLMNWMERLANCLMAELIL